MIGYNRDELIGKNIIKPALAPEYSCRALLKT
ncbi:MAG TPA: hypothetical protein DDY13_09895, partial [Cytophagales bacterium]|nr:hypothetical protein [Cytophagales bacterium]